MKTFAYYYKNQMPPEPVGKVKAIDSEEATISAATIKQLGIDEFLQIFEIKEYDRRSEKENGSTS